MGKNQQLNNYRVITKIKSYGDKVNTNFRGKKY